MAFSLTADPHLLSWTSSSFLKETRKINHINHPVLQLKARLPHGSCAASFIDRSELGWLSQKHKPLFSFCLTRNGGKNRFRVVAQAGRSKHKSPQPISPRRRRHVTPPSGRQPDPGGNIRKRKSSNTQEQEPYVRHPDDYYKFGPFGPYSYKAAVEGTMIPVQSIMDDYVAFFSTVRDIQHQEEIDIRDACIRYQNRVQTFDASIGLKFFYVFVRLPYHVVREPPWRQWTLVSEITVESGEDLDKETLFFRLPDGALNKISKYTSWFRPDLVHVRPRRRHYQVRFEPQEKFLEGLADLLYKSAGEADEADSYYGLFCQILELGLNAGPEDVISKYEASSGDVKLACLEQLLLRHPVQLLYPIPFPNRSVWNAKQSTVESPTVNNGEASMEMDMSDGKEQLDDNDEDEGDNEAESDDDDWTNLDDAEIEARLSKGISEFSDDEPESEDPNDHDRDDIDSDDEETERSKGDVDVGGPGVSNVPGGTSMVKAAARPYTYINFIREMAILRGMLLEQKRRRSKVLTLH